MLIGCYQPKKEVMEDKEKIKNYKRAMYYDQSSITDFHPYYREHVGDDFYHAWYDRKTYKRIAHPKPKDIIHDAFINSKNYLKFIDIPDLEKGSFCEVVQDLMLPSDDDVGLECRKVLKVKEFLGFEF